MMSLSSMTEGGCGVLFLDLTKVFDTVDYIILERKLQYLGFKRSAIAVNQPK